ncbi:MAG: DUF432 domain-containing protein [Candidatus Cloacimonetes bacterium]|nr:DUF432 domain-containing protein [Candidatus Cloacimonadota bacterium]
MYGTHEIPLSLQEKDISINVTKTEFGYQYIRQIAGGLEFQKALLAVRSKILITPVEPLNHPKHITNFLLLEFDRELMIAPQQEKTLYATFPIELGVFIYAKQTYELFDKISCIPAKYSLYGDPKNGVVVRYHLTSVYSKIPQVDPLHFGIIQMNIKNNNSNWNTITKIVLNAYGMKLYYSPLQVKLFASMKISDELSAETDCYEPSTEKNFKKSIEIYQSKKLSILTTKFNMMDGI